jgi:hypothetical protein
MKTLKPEEVKESGEYFAKWLERGRRTKEDRVFCWQPVLVWYDKESTYVLTIGDSKRFPLEQFAVFMGPLRMTEVADELAK